jgi:hypothetical protein
LPSVSSICTWVLAGIERMWSQLAPRRQAGEIAAAAVDAVRSRRELVLENAVLRHQVNVLRRRSKRPKLHLVDRLKLLLGARWLPSWRRVIVLVQPETGAMPTQNGDADPGCARRRRCRARRST